MGQPVLFESPPPIASSSSSKPIRLSISFPYHKFRSDVARFHVALTLLISEFNSSSQPIRKENWVPLSGLYSLLRLLHDSL
jgi:hypothetical protein